MYSYQHGPKTKYNILITIKAFLYDPSFKELKKRRQGICIKNAALLKNGVTHFTYKGEQYYFEDDHYSGKRNRIHPSLIEEAEAYLLEYKELHDVEIPRVMGYITHVMNSSNRLSDYLKLLPDMLHGTIVHLVEHSSDTDTLHLNSEEVSLMLAKHQDTIQLIKQRMVLNLII